MKPETLQESVWLLLAGERGREKRVAAMLGVDRSTVSQWANGDVQVRLAVIDTVQQALQEYHVSEFMNRSK